jgi:hypothetical protein
MTVVIASLEDPSFDARVSGSLPAYSHESREFTLNRPIGDDWLQKIRCIPEPSPVLVRTEGQTMIVVFSGRGDAARFEQWLRDARHEQEHGFRTMRG